MFGRLHSLGTHFEAASQPMHAQFVAATSALALFGPSAATVIRERGAPLLLPVRRLRRAMASFGVPSTSHVSSSCAFCRAVLALQGPCPSVKVLPFASSWSNHGNFCCSCSLCMPFHAPLAGAMFPM